MTTRHVTVLVLVTTLCCLASARNQAGTAQGTINGADQPELIDDREAVDMFFIMMADGPKSFSWADRAKYLEPSGLSRDQVASVLAAATAFKRTRDLKYARATAIYRQYRGRTLPASARDELEALGKEISTAFDATYSRLKAELGASGTEKFEAWIRETFKRTMVMGK